MPRLLTVLSPTDRLWTDRPESLPPTYGIRRAIAATEGLHA